MFICGIDPGLSGAIAFYEPNSGELQVFDMPTHTKTVSGKDRRVIDIYGLGRIIDSLAHDISLAVVEQVNAMPKQGVSSSFNFGFAAGCAQMAIAALNIPLRTVRPATWKKEMHLQADKNASRQEASRLMPKHAGLWPLVKHDGRAEASLLAYYGAQQEKA